MSRFKYIAIAIQVLSHPICNLSKPTLTWFANRFLQGFYRFLQDLHNSMSQNLKLAIYLDLNIFGRNILHSIPMIEFLLIS